MFDVIVLENKWRKYRFKLYVQRLIILTVLVLMSLVAWITLMATLKGTTITSKPEAITTQKSNVQSGIKQKTHADVSAVKNNKIDKVMPLEISSNTALSIEGIRARYSQNRNYEDAIYLAKAYYELKEYEKVEYWALEANKFDSTDEQSWILFAKTKFILGKEGDAIRAIEAYLEKHHSQKLQELLFKMEEALTH